ncbi:MAG: M20/M25/M40 family metallo-hydrolase [Planctomycetota bacterium]|nr:M20/M25/M40 family metallo-hydrolase [Planctomycetota bacterium]MDA1113655.1 M20/M25/M40 family metallo-hydrolase [Planctomycetota bacterium]
MTLKHFLAPALLAAILPLSTLAAQTASDASLMPNTGLPVSDSVVDAVYAIPDEEMQVTDILDQLSNGIGPRLTSSSSLMEASEWAADQFRSFGIEDVRMEVWGTFPVGFDRHSMTGRMISPEKRELVFTTNSWTPGTDGPVRGAALLAPNTDEELDALRGNLRGAWILASSDSVAPRFGEPRDGDEEALNYRFGLLCDKEGIAGVIRPGRGELVHTRGNYRIEWDNLPTHVGVSLRRDQFRTIFDNLKNDEAVELEFNIHQTFREGPIPLYNIIAEIPGTDLADQMVIFGGHIDSWDGARGAQDNGTGTSTTLEAARILSSILKEQGLQPRRTIRFMLWSGEEQGLLGSRGYIEKHPEEMEHISSVIVHDGGTNACSGISTTPNMMPIFAEAFAPIIGHTENAEDEHLRFRLVEKNALPRGVGSDHDAYLSGGVPGFFWEQSGETNYTYIHHTQHDTTDEVREDYQRFTARVVASAAWRLANMEPMVPRDDMGTPKKRQLLGINLGESSKLENVSDGSLAHRAGMKKGDTLLSIGDVAITNMGDIRKAMRDDADRRKVSWKRGEETFSAWFDWKKDSVEAITS